MTAMLRRTRHIHFVGIGGIGMSGIAELLLNLGFQVSGSDLAASPTVQRLRGLGADVRIGHAADHVEGVDVVVVSSAVTADNPEVQEALRRKVAVIPRAEMLAELMRMKYSVAVAGSHGKTTTTSMIAQVLASTGFDPTAIVGGRLGVFGSNARLGGGDLIVAEADESDGSFLKLSPTIAVATNLDDEHLEHYGDFPALQQAFVDFLNEVPFYGAAVICLDEPPLQELLPRLTRRVITYGLSGQAQVSARRLLPEGFGTRFEAIVDGEPVGDVVVPFPGRHNVYNALATLAVALELDVPFADAAAALATSEAPDRRFQHKGSANDVLVVDDYGHHPTEIRATLAAAKQGWDRRVVAVFQPHRYSRVEHLLEEFARSFYDADVVVVTDIYPAGEPPRPGVDAERVARAITEHGHRDVLLRRDLDEATRTLARRARPGDLVITLGAGDVWKVGEALLRALAAPPGEESS